MHRPHDGRGCHYRGIKVLIVPFLVDLLDFQMFSQVSYCSFLALPLSTIAVHPVTR